MKLTEKQPNNASIPDLQCSFSGYVVDDLGANYKNHSSYVVFQKDINDIRKIF